MAQSEDEHFFEVNDEAAFERFFKTHYQSLLHYAYLRLRDETAAEDVVQQVFLNIWHKRTSLKIHTSLKAFLYKAVHNECLNYLKHERYKLSHEKHSLAIEGYDYIEKRSDPVVLTELQLQIEKTINGLPEQCRHIFYLNRIQELKYREIADELGLSIKTVEAQISKALKVLRKKLADYLPLLLSVLFYHRWLK